MTVGELKAAIQNLADDLELEKNRVGNLAIFRDGQQVGYIDLQAAEVDIYQETPAE